MEPREIQMSELLQIIGELYMENRILRGSITNTQSASQIVSQSASDGGSHANGRTDPATPTTASIDNPGSSRAD